MASDDQARIDALLTHVFRPGPLLDSPHGLAERAMLRVRLDRVQRQERERYWTSLLQGSALMVGATTSLGALLSRVGQLRTTEWSIPGGRGIADYFAVASGDWTSTEGIATLVGAVVVGVSLLSLSTFSPSRSGRMN